MRIVNVQGRNDSFEIPPTQHSDKENSPDKEIQDVESLQTPKTKQSQVFRNLSPVNIVVSSSEEVNEQLTQPSSSKVPALPKSDSRRSLFSKSKRLSSKAPFNFSTPLAVGRKSASRRFFNRNDDVAPSPIKASTNSQPEVEISSSDTSKNDRRNHQSASLGGFEENLRAQYNIPKGSTNVPPRRSSSVTAAKKSKQISDTSNHDVRQCSVVVDKINLDNDAISQYRKQLVSRLSVRENVTDVDSVAMQETNISPRRSSVNNTQFALLKKKLNQCETIDLTDDESDLDGILPSEQSPAARRSRIPKEKSAAHASNEMSEDDIEITLKKMHEQISRKDNNHVPSQESAGEPSQEQSGPVQNSNSQSNDENAQEPTLTSREDSVNRILPQNFVESFRNLRNKTQNNLTKSDPSNTVTNMKEPRCQKSIQTKSYLAITKPQGKIRKSKKHEKRKRTLYNVDDENSGDSNTSEESPNNDEPCNIEQLQVENTEVSTVSENIVVNNEENSTARNSKRKRQESDTNSEPPQQNNHDDFEFKRPTQAVKKSKKNKVASSKSNKVIAPPTRSNPSKRPTTVNRVIEPESETCSTASTRSQTNKKEVSAQPKEKRFKRIRLIGDDDEDVEEQNTADEGFGSGNEKEQNDEDDILYEPNNHRYGLRTRKTYKPYWLFSAKDRNVGIRFTQNACELEPKSQWSKLPSCLYEEKFVKHKPQADGVFKKPAPKTKSKTTHITPIITTESSTTVSSTVEMNSAATSTSMLENQSITKYHNSILRFIRGDNASCGSIASSYSVTSENGRRKSTE